MLNVCVSVSGESPFDVLGIDEGASDDVVEQAYRELVLEKHPDVGGDADEFVRVKAAYESIMNGAVDSFGSGGGSVDVGREWRSRAWTGSEAGWGGSSDSAASGAVVRFVDYSVLDELDEEVKELVNNPVLMWERVNEMGELGELDDDVYGEFPVSKGQSVLEAAEVNGFSWPFSCRGGACANCAVKVLEGEMSTESYHILSEELLEQGYRLSCLGVPVSQVVYLLCNVAGSCACDELDELLLPGRE